MILSLFHRANSSQVLSSWKRNFSREDFKVWAALSFNWRYIFLLLKCGN